MEPHQSDGELTRRSTIIYVVTLSTEQAKKEMSIVAGSFHFRVRRFVAERRSSDSMPLSGVVSFQEGAGPSEGLGLQSFCRRFGVVPRRHPSDVVLKAFPCHSSTVQRRGEGRGVLGGTSKSSVLRRSWIVRHAFRWERLAPSFVTERTKNGNLSLSKDV